MTGDQLQRSVASWVTDTFGAESMPNSRERAFRFLEEATELAQAMGLSTIDCYRTIANVFVRPVGKPLQEVGGCVTTLAAAAECLGISMLTAGEQELTRMWDEQDLIKEKQKRKQLRG